MRWIQILFGFCIILNLYQSRYLILQSIEICLHSIIFLSSSTHRFIQQQINSPRDSDNEPNVTSNFNYNLSHYEYECPQHRYNIQMIERRPLIIYIEQFLTQNEIEHLIELG